MAELSGGRMERQGMSWGNVFNRTVGNKIVTREEKARQAGYDQGYKEASAAAQLGRPRHHGRELEMARLQGYIKGLANTLLAIEAMPPKTGRKQILAVVQDQLQAKREQLVETQAQEVRGD